MQKELRRIARNVRAIVFTDEEMRINNLSVGDVILFDIKAVRKANGEPTEIKQSWYESEYKKVSQKPKTDSSKPTPIKPSTKGLQKTPKSIKNV